MSKYTNRFWWVISQDIYKGWWRLKGASCSEDYTNLFETSIVEVFKVGVSSVLFRTCVVSPVGKDSLEVKHFINVKFLWITAATIGRFYEWVRVFLENHKKERLPWVRLWPLSDFIMAVYIYICQKNDNQFSDITYISTTTESKIFEKKK